ncbi:enoyl-CoA hydratase-related protein [Roseomonas sp. ACRSG]|nr:enoyl-CoA hydratase-related protein [Roseomonas sp. ACRSG]
MGIQSLPRNIGRKAAAKLTLTGRRFDAAEGLRVGLIHRVLPASYLLDAALSLAADLAAKPPLTLAAALSAIHRGMEAFIDDGLAIEGAAFARIVLTQDARGSRLFWKNGRHHTKAGEQGTGMGC